MNDITVCVNDKCLLQLITAELERNGRSVGTQGDCSLLIMDIDSPVCNNGITCHKLIGISREPEHVSKTGFDAVLRRPLMMSELRETVNGMLDEKTKQGIEPVSDEQIVLDGDSAVFGTMRVHLTDNERRVLSLLLEKRGETVSREELNGLFGNGREEADVYICFLRRKLIVNGRNPIKTVRGHGYILE